MSGQERGREKRGFYVLRETELSRGFAGHGRAPRARVSPGLSSVFYSIHISCLSACAKHSIESIHLQISCIHRNDRQSSSMYSRPNMCLLVLVLGPLAALKTSRAQDASATFLAASAARCIFVCSDRVINLRLIFRRCHVCFRTVCSIDYL